jgi:hypothetical protein
MGVSGLDWPGLDREDAIQKEDECSSPSWSVESGRSGSSGGFHGELGAVPSVNSSDLPPSAHTWEKRFVAFFWDLRMVTVCWYTPARFYNWFGHLGRNVGFEVLNEFWFTLRDTEFSSYDIVYRWPRNKTFRSVQHKLGVFDWYALYLNVYSLRLASHLFSSYRPCTAVSSGLVWLISLFYFCLINTVDRGIPAWAKIYMLAKTSVGLFHTVWQIGVSW